MDAQWVRTYRPDPDRLDERPVMLSGGFITDDPEDLIMIATAALVKRGHVILQRYSLADLKPDERVSARDAVQCERRW